MLSAGDVKREDKYQEKIVLMNPDDPIVGTGLEAKVAADSRAAVTSPVNGRIHYVDSEKIVIIPIICQIIVNTITYGSENSFTISVYCGIT